VIGDEGVKRCILDPDRLDPGLFAFGLHIPAPDCMMRAAIILESKNVKKQLVNGG
jgi:hypothetical protein